MENTFPSSNLYSHPDKLLEDHLINVANLMESFILEKPQFIKDELKGVARIIGLTHDIGKATRYFQEYLFAEESEKLKLKSEYSAHSLFSSICTYFSVKEFCQRTGNNNELLPLFAYIIVRRHHDDLIDVMDELSLFNDKNLQILQKQLESIDDNSFSMLCETLYQQGIPVLINKQILQIWFNEFESELKQYRKSIRKIKDFIPYLTLNILYSILLDADKNEVVLGNSNFPERKDYNEKDWVDKYITYLNPISSQINELRNNAYREVNEKNFDPKQKIYSINLPTGFGKTLTGFSFALKLKNELKKGGVNPRIIYSLPFLSIIEQNSQVIEEVLEINGIASTSNIVLKHHHLAEIFYKTQEKEYKPDEAEILIEGWNSEIIITTFVQLFHTLFSNKNSSLRKFHRLANSIIILDEIQTIPIKYWKLIKTILMLLVEKFNSYIILMTATEPLIFNKNEILSMTESSKYYDRIDRIELISEVDNPVKIEDLANQVNENQGYSKLFIFNTISSAKEFYYLIKDTPLPKTFLSTHILPVERQKRIDEIRKGKYKLVVSTQLVEAGVDIDFDMVYRDIAPLDSIIQSAGRCNRNAANKKGTVRVFTLIDEKNRRYASYIYDIVLIDITEKLISTQKIFNEKELYQLLDKYFQQTSERLNQTESAEILDAISRLRYDRQDSDGLAISDFKLIQEDYPKIDVFVEYDETAVKVWKEFEKIKMIKNFFERKKEFLQIRKNFYDYIISIPVNTENLPPKIMDTYYISQNQIEDYYDQETGFKTKAEVLLW
ncbi:CRISPR-associated helicase Cas3' [Thermodesulfovibrio sp. 3907-1M]|uniref:CRISPR-associated helicase Cas3 n=1 Tax=Thermodesulfovibrio autotrophicus TaxID=3118333 RepID=A0AAU8GYI6_9BACT